jgi:uncharacterized membrane protein (UPF0127 family)
VRRWASTIVFGILFVGGVLFLGIRLQAQANELRLHGHSYHISIQRTDAEREKGLSGTASLAKNKAMLFVFPNDDKWRIWMKDMNYPIDIVWLDSDKNVIYVVKDAQPSSYPNTIFKSDKNARYVIELASGTIERTGISLGDPAGIPSGV